MTYEEAIALINSGKPLSKKKIWDITDLGYALYYGKQGLERDPYKAVVLYKRAARKKDEMAASNLGECYEKGEGVEVNPREALRWYRLAKRWGNEDVDEAIARMKQVVKTMKLEP